MKVLAIDTSNNSLGIALVDEDQVIGEYMTNMKKNHSVRVMPAIEKLMSDCEMVPADLEKIVVAKGPGSYTGIRIGVTIAKTLAWTLNIPLVGISSLEALAAVGRYFDGYVSPLFDARRGQIYTGLYQYQNGLLTSVVDDQIILSKNWADKLSIEEEKVLFVGSDISIHQEILKQILGEKAVFADKTEHNPRPAKLAYLGFDLPGEDVHTFCTKLYSISRGRSQMDRGPKKIMIKGSSTQ